jgi:hypothetical protein
MSRRNRESPLELANVHYYQVIDTCYKIILTKYIVDYQETQYAIVYDIRSAKENELYCTVHSALHICAN